MIIFDRLEINTVEDFINHCKEEDNLIITIQQDF
jgi:hypothetical protein